MTSLVAHGRAPGGLRLGRYLPLSAAVTLAVLALPLLAVAQLGPARTVLEVAAQVLLAVVLSIALARLLALAWTRHPLSSDLVFGDLLIWGWVRRAWTDRQLEHVARELDGRGPDAGDNERLLQRLSALLEARHPYTRGHSRRVARYAERIARGMGLSADEVAKVRAAALVHDLGKINIPRSILTKPVHLTDAEFELVKRHAADGAALVAEHGDPELAPLVRHHHERLDGTGYPDGLAGQDIPVGARIIAVADTFDAITSARPYRKPRPHKVALDLVRQATGSQLDPDAVTAFTGYYASWRSVGWVTALVAVAQRLISGVGGAQSGGAVGAGALAQGACGVGAAALIGACLSSPAPEGDWVAQAPQQAAAVARPAQAPAVTAGPSPLHVVERERAASATALRQHVEQRGPGGVEGELGPRELESPGQPAPGGGVGEPPPSDGGEGEVPPSGGGDQSGSGGGASGGGASGGDTAGNRPVVALPDPDRVTEPVNDLLPPEVQLPDVDLPPVQLPPTQVQVPGVQVPGIQVPGVRLGR